MADGADHQSPIDAEQPLGREVRARLMDLLAALEHHRPGARAIADAAAGLAFVTAAELDLDRETAERVREVARFHAIGLLYEPAGHAFSTERAAAHGAALAGAAGLADEMCEWIARAVERPDGRGAAHATPGGAPPIEARIVRVASAAAAFLAGEAGEEAGAASEAERAGLAAFELRTGSGTLYDPRAAEALAGAIEGAAQETGGA